MFVIMKAVSLRREDLEDLKLTPDQVNACKDRFFSLDISSRGSINRMDLRVLLEQCGESVSEDAMQRVLSWLDESGTKKLDLPAALKALNKMKEINEAEADDTDIDIRTLHTVNAFVAMGGETDKSGCIRKQRLQSVLVDVFGMKVSIDQMLEEAGLEVEDELKFEDFNILLTAGAPERASRIRSLFSIVSSK